MSPVVDQLHVYAGAFLALGGAVLGLLFGAIVQRTGYCAMGAVSDVILLGDGRRLRSWSLAVAVALLATSGLRDLGLAPIETSSYAGPRVDWAGALLGGLAFGIGMVMAGGCVSRNVVRAGTGDLRALVVLVVVGVAVEAMLTGLPGAARSALAEATALDVTALGLRSQGLDALVEWLAGRPAAASGVALAAALPLLVLCLASSPFRRSGAHVTAGLGIGLVVSAGWLVTSLARDELAMQPMAPTSLTFVRPTGDLLAALARAPAWALPTFGVAALLGTAAGAWLAARTRGPLTLLSFADGADTLRHLAGAVLMGLGGVTAGGCTIGQGVTGLSTLALTSLIAVASMIAGAALGVRLLERLVLRQP